MGLSSVEHSTELGSSILVWWGAAAQSTEPSCKALSIRLKAWCSEVEQTDRSGISRHLQRCCWLGVIPGFSSAATGHASSSSLYGAVISSSQWSIAAVRQSHDAGIPQPRAVRRSVGLPREVSSMARRNSTRSIAPLRLGSCFPTSRLRDGESLDTGSSSDSTGGDLRRRNFISTVFTAIHHAARWKGRIAAKRAEIAKYLHESLLRQIFCFSHIFRHSQTNGIHAFIVQLVEWQKACSSPR